MVLIGLLYKHFIDNLSNGNFPNHVIHVSKQYLLNIEEIRINYDMSEVNLPDSSSSDRKSTRLNSSH